MNTDSPEIAPPDAQPGFEKLLSMLDPDRDRAGAKYVEAHRRLEFYFQRRGCLIPEDLADETLNRVARKLDLGGDTGVIDHYWYGVARLVLKEHWANRNPHIPDLDELPLHLEPSIDPRDEREQDSDEWIVRKSECMSGCIELLPEPERHLIKQYIGTKDREDLAALLGLNVKTLRVKIHRIRTKLNNCLRKCLERLRSGSGRGGAEDQSWDRFAPEAQ